VAGRSVGAILFCVLMVSIIAVRSASALLPGFVDEQVVSGLSGPTAIAVAPDGRQFITEQKGAVRVVRDRTLLAAPFVKLNVDSDGERGLLGIALHPAFVSNHFIYVYHTVPGTPPHNRVTRFTADGNVARPGSARVILDLNSLSTRTNHTRTANSMLESARMPNRRTPNRSTIASAKSSASIRMARFPLTILPSFQGSQAGPQAPIAQSGPSACAIPTPSPSSATVARCSSTMSGHRPGRR
jgi:hypothetical protein